MRPRRGGDRRPRAAAERDPPAGLRSRPGGRPSWQDARGLVATLRGGASFAALARQVSAAGSAENGGDLGWVPVSAIIPDLRDQIAALPVGADLRPDRQRGRRPHLPGPRPARAGRRRRGGPRGGAPGHRAAAARAPGQPLPARPAPGRVRRRPDLTPPAASAAGCAPRACTPTSGWASISCSTRRSCAASPPPRAISAPPPCWRSARAPAG